VLGASRRHQGSAAAETTTDSVADLTPGILSNIKSTYVRTLDECCNVALAEGIGDTGTCVSSLSQSRRRVFPG